VKYVVLAAVLFTSASPVSAAVTFLSADIFAVTQLTLRPFPPETYIDSQSIASAVPLFGTDVFFSSPTIGIAGILGGFSSALAGGVRYEVVAFTGGCSDCDVFSLSRFSYTFELTSNANFRVSSAGPSTGPVGIARIGHSLSDITMGTLVFGIDPGPFNQSYVLTPGRYRYVVDANADSFSGLEPLGQVVGNSTFEISEIAAAIPEPDAWAMMLAGFGMVGGMVRYRRRSTKVELAAGRFA